MSQSPSPKSLNIIKKRKQIAFRRFMRGLGSGKGVKEYLGCNRTELRQHIERLMLPEMNWLNYGSVWVIDHIVPVRLFNLWKPEECRIVWNYKNLLPLLKEDNLHKEGDLRFSLLVLNAMDGYNEIIEELKCRCIKDISRMEKYLAICGARGEILIDAA